MQKLKRAELIKSLSDKFEKSRASNRSKKYNSRKSIMASSIRRNNGLQRMMSEVPQKRTGAKHFNYTLSSNRNLSV